MNQTHSATLTGSQVGVSPQTVHATATLNVRATLATTVPAGGRIIVTLPSVMSVSGSSTLACTFAEPTSVAVATCANVGNVVTATLSTTALPNSFFQLNIASVVNPPSTTTTSSFQLQTQDSSGNTLDSQTSNIFLSATAGTLASTTLTPASQVVGATTTLTVSLTTTNTVLANGKIKVTFPKWNSQATISANILSMIESGFGVTAITNLNAGISATFSNDVLTITGGFSSNLAAGSVISFSVTNFKNPITTSTFSGFTIATTDSSDGTIDSASATMRITTPTSIYDTSFVSKDTTEVQENAVFRLQFKIPVPLNSGCIMDITFPSDFALNGADLTTVQGFGLFGGARVLTGSLNVGNNTYTISDGCDGYVSQDIIGILDFNSIENPFSIKPTGSVSIYVKDSSQFSVAQITAGITYTASVGALTGVTLTPENTVVSTSTSITLTFLPAHALIADETRIEITLPSDVSIAAQSNPSTCSLSDLKFISPTVQCTVISNTITLIDPFSVAYTPTSTEVLGFKISGMTMPPSLKPPGAVVITTKVGTSTFYSVDTVSASSLFVSTVGSISEYSITPASFVAYATTTYTFTFKAQNAILQNGYITVDYPSQISIPNTSTAASSCAGVSGFQTTISCTISGSKIKVSNGFQTGNLAAGTQVSFSMGNIRSPVSTQTSSSFTYTTFDSSNYQIDTRSSGITVTMTSVNDLQSAAVTLGSSVNGATTAYTFTMVASSPLINGDKIYIRVPSTISPSVSPTCTGVTALASSLTCNTLNREILVTLAFSSGSTLTAGSTFSFSIANFVNPSSTKPSDALTFQAQDTTGALINAYTSATPVKITTTTSATITTASVSNENQLASQSTTINLKFTTIHELPLNGIIIITYPTEISPFDNTVTTLTCSLNIATSPTCTHNAASRTITISNIITTTALAASTAVEVTVNEMKNPSTATATGTFTIATYEVSSGTNYIIDQVTSGLTITVDCNYPCKTCSASNKSECSACLPDASGNTLLLQTTTSGGVSTTSCVSTCNEDYVNINNIWQPCLANCGACLTTNRSSCTKWGKAAAPFLVGTRCTSSCPTGTYGNSSTNTCDNWVYPCETCTDATTCQSWAEFDGSGNKSTLTKLQNNKWVASCTANTSVNINNVCTPCSSNCEHCSEQTTICTKCTSSLILNKGSSTCVSTCPSGTTIYDSTAGTCEVCSTNCATCSGSINNCITCDSGLLLTTSNTCATSCLTTNTYVNSNSQCVKCDTGCLTCSGTSSYCDTCNTSSGYLFSNFTCVTTCPSGFVIDLNDSTRCVLSGLQWPFGYEIDKSGTACEPSNIVCKTGYTVNSDKTKCIPEPGTIVPFPFFIIFVVMVIVILIGYWKHRQEMITTWLIKAIAILEMPYLIVQIYSAVYVSSWGICIGTIVALWILVATNICFYIIYNVSIVKDNAFKHWKDKFKHSSRTIAVTSLLFNFKIFRWLYSKFFGASIFNAPFESSALFYRPFIVLNIVYLLLCITPIIIVDIVIFYFIQWGYQLLIVGIESFVFSIFIIILSFIEFFKIKRKLFKDDEESYLAVNPKMFDNAYTVAGGIPDNDMNQRLTTQQKVKGVPQFEDSHSSYMHHSYSYNADRKYDDVTNLSSIGIISRFNSNKGLMDDAQKQKRLQLQNIVRRRLDKAALKKSSPVNIMDFKDNRIFKKRRDYDVNVKLDREEVFNEHDRQYMRRSQSYEDFREVDETFAPNRRELIEGKCISYPPSPREMEEIDHYLFSDRAEDIRDRLKAEYAFNNIYADREGADFDPEDEYGRIRARRVQTYGRDFHRLHRKGEEDKEDAEIDPDMAQSILDGVLGNLSDDDDDIDNQLVRRTKRERMALAKKRKMEIPDFAIEDIMGEFDIDDQGNYIILRNEENGNLEDNKERKVNRRGYLVDKDNNIVDKYGNLIFKERELDSDDEIPPPYSFEKRKMQLLNQKPDDIDEYNLADIAPEDDEHIWMDPKGKEFAESLSGDETPVESMMGETPGRYLPDKMSRKSKATKKRRAKKSTINEENINIDLESQKETVKLNSSMRPQSIKSSNRTKRLISARVNGLGNEGRPGTTYDGYVRDVPFYMNHQQLLPDSRKNTPKKRKRLRKKGPHDDSLKRIYGNIDPFLYKDDSAATGVRLDKVTQIKDKMNADPFKLAESAEVQGRLGMINSDEDINSDLYRNSRLDRVPSRYKDRSVFGDTVTKTKVGDLEDIYAKRSKMNESEMMGRKTTYNSKMNKMGQKNANTITRNIFTAESSRMESGRMRSSKSKRKNRNNSRPSVDQVLKPRGIEDGGWV